MFVAQAKKTRIFGFCIESVVDLFVDHLIVYFFGISENGSDFWCGFGNRRNIWSFEPDKTGFRRSLHGFGLKRRIGHRHYEGYPNGVEAQ